MNIPEIDLPRLVILGGGFAGLKLARSVDSRFVQTVLIDQNNFHTFQPLLYQVATSGLEPDSIAYPLRKTLKNKKRTHIRMASVERIVLNENKIMTSIGDLNYDLLVIATGSKTNYFGNTQIEDHAMPMKQLTESLDLRSMILQNFETALNENNLEIRDSLMNFVIVGGGPTGVELAGALAELRTHVLPKDYPDLDIRRMQINLIEAGSDLLGTMSNTSSDLALDYMRSLDINVWLNTTVRNYDGYTIITSKNTFHSANLIWAAGVTGNIPNGIPNELLEKGRIIVNEFGSISTHDNVMAVGDVALMKSGDQSLGLPMLGAVAQQQGKYLADRIKRKIQNKTQLPFKYADKGTMATIGRNLAVVDLGAFNYGGFLAWLTWVFVHLMLLVDFRNRIVVLFNWIWGYINFDRGTRLIVRKFKGRPKVTKLKNGTDNQVEL